MKSVVFECVDKKKKIIFATINFTHDLQDGNETRSPVNITMFSMSCGRWRRTVFTAWKTSTSPCWITCSIHALAAQYTPHLPLPSLKHIRSINALNILHRSQAKTALYRCVFHRRLELSYRSNVHIVFCVVTEDEREECSLVNVLGELQFVSIGFPTLGSSWYFLETQTYDIDALERVRFENAYRGFRGK